MVTNATSDLNHFNSHTIRTSSIPSVRQAHSVSTERHSQMTQKQADMSERRGCISPEASKALGVRSISNGRRCQVPCPDAAGRERWVSRDCLRICHGGSRPCFSRLQRLPRTRIEHGVTRSPSFATTTTIWLTSPCSIAFCSVIIGLDQDFVDLQ